MKSPVHSRSRRRTFFKTLLSVPVLLSSPMIYAGADPKSRPEKSLRDKPDRLKLSLNAYSFNDQLLNGSMTLDELLEFCSEKGLIAADLTGYYFPGYPNVPSDEFLYDLKRKAFRLGVEISGTGVRNDFTDADPEKRRESLQLVRNWIDVAEKIGAQTIRIFSGNQKPEGYSRAQVLEWMLKDIRECIAYGKAHGVMVALQNHNDFIKTADDIIEIMNALKSDWFGLMLDIGSFRTADAYEEISRTVIYAVTWQIKEKVFVSGKEVDVDADKLVSIIRRSGYIGYLPLEALGKGDPKMKVSALLEKFRRSFGKA